MVVRYKKERTLLLNNLVASMVHTKQDQLATSSNKVKDTIPAGHHVRPSVFCSLIKNRRVILGVKS